MNGLDSLLVEAQAGRISVRQLLGVLFEGKLVVPSSTEIQEDGTGLSPLYYERNGSLMMAIYSHIEHAKCLSEEAPFCAVMTARELFHRLPAGCGIVLNPRCSVGMDMPPDGINAALTEFLGNGKAGSLTHRNTRPP